MDTELETQEANEIAVTIGERVKELREKVAKQINGKYSQEKLASEIVVIDENGNTKPLVTRAMMGHIETGRKLPSTEVLFALADHFDTTVEYLRGKTEICSSMAAIEEDLLTGGISGRLSELYKKLPSERQRELYEFAEALHKVAQKEQDDAQRAEDDVAALEAVTTVIARRYGEDARDEILAHLARTNPRWRLILDRATASKKKGIKRS
jgi:transcriptional regulator with XRE-family HTH domain